MTVSVRPTASVVVPVRDDAEALRSLLAALDVQTEAPLQVVVVDNGSSDGGAETARAAGALVVSESEQGIGAAAARGYDTAEGDLILRLDADTVPPPDWVERIVDAFAADDGLGALTGPGRFGGLPGPLDPLATGGYLGIYFTVIGALLVGPPLFGSNLAMRRTAWRAVSGQVHRHDDRVHDDLDLTLHIAPRFRTRLDRTLVVGISARPLFSPFGMLRRLRRAVHTLLLHRTDIAALRRRRRV